METITKFIVNVFQLIVIFKIALFLAKVATGRFHSSTSRKGNRKKSIIYKLYTLAINPIIFKLDDLIYKQKQKRLEAMKERQIPNNPKIINIKSLKKYKSAK